MSQLVNPSWTKKQRQSVPQMVLEQLDIHMQKNESQPRLHALHEN